MCTFSSIRLFFLAADRRPRSTSSISRPKGRPLRVPPALLHPAIDCITREGTIGGAITNANSYCRGGTKFVGMLAGHVLQLDVTRKARKVITQVLTS